MEVHVCGYLAIYKLKMWLCSYKIVTLVYSDSIWQHSHSHVLHDLVMKSHAISRYNYSWRSCSL